MEETLHQGCVVIILSEDKKRQILLIKRGDFRVWVPPGGSMDPEESPETCAVREALEESGYRVALDRLVGRFYCDNAPSGSLLSYLFIAHVIGGRPLQRGPETRAVAWFPVDRLPRSMLAPTKSRIAIALQEHEEPLEVQEHFPAWQALLLALMIWLRDQYNRFFHPDLYAARPQALWREWRKKQGK